MKSTVITIMLAVFCIAGFAQAEHQPEGKEKSQWSKERYKDDMERCIVERAMLSPQEAEDFFPIFDEMKDKQRSIHDRLKRMERELPSTEQDFRDAIKQKDNLEMELKEIEQTYHNKFLTILPASKVYRVIQAENDFHRRMLRDWGKGKSH